MKANRRIGSIRRKMPLLLVLAFMFAARSMPAAIVASMQQVGLDVVVFGSGVIYLPAGFNTMGFHTIYSPAIAPDRAQVYLGGFGQQNVLMTGVSGPSSIGPGTNISVPNGSGPPVGIAGNVGSLLLPYQYVAGTGLSFQDTFGNKIGRAHV